MWFRTNSPTRSELHAGNQAGLFEGTCITLRSRPLLNTALNPHFSRYLQLTKPRIVALLVFCAVIGMFLAVPGVPPWRALVFGMGSDVDGKLAEYRPSTPDSVSALLVESNGTALAFYPAGFDGPGLLRDMRKVIK